MAKLTCNSSEFNKFIGPRIRNAIQAITKGKKREIGYVCQGQNCGRKAELEASHVRGKERQKIIMRILRRHGITKTKRAPVDLELVEKEIIAAHMPIEKYFKFLCRSCHEKYHKKS